MEYPVKDYIVSGSRNERYFSIEYTPSQELAYYCYGKVFDSRPPGRLSWLLEEYDQLVQHVVLTLLDEVEDEILTYELRLENAGQRIFNVMLIGDEISFFTQPALDEDESPNGEDTDGSADSRETL